MTTHWQVTTVLSVIEQSPTARSIRLALSEPMTAIAGQHVDVRLTAADGYSTARAYSLSDTRETSTIEVTVERLDDGEVSPYLVDEVVVGDPLEISGPNGGWFTWDPSQSRPGVRRPVQLIGGGSGVVPLMSMIRAREVAAPDVEFSLVYSARSADRVYFRDELNQLVAHRRLPVDVVYTRIAPEGAARPAGRLDATELVALSIGPGRSPDVFICGPNPFVESCAQWMVAAGHDPARIRTERFGGAGV